MKPHTGTLRHSPEVGEGCGGEKFPGSLREPFLFRVPSRVNKDLGPYQLCPSSNLGGRLIREVIGLDIFGGRGV